MATRKKASGQGGSHAETRLLTGKESVVLVARFNIADLVMGIFNPLLAKPCNGCQDCIRFNRPKKVWFTNQTGNVELLT